MTIEPTAQATPTTGKPRIVILGGGFGGVYAALHLERLGVTGRLAGRPLAPFVYTSKGTLASLGLYKGVGDVMGFRIYGFLAWWVWRTYYMLQMPRFERRLRVVLDWTVALFFKNDVVKLDFYTRDQAPKT